MIGTTFKIKKQSTLDRIENWEKMKITEIDLSECGDLRVIPSGIGRVKGIQLKLPQDTSKMEFPPPEICKEGSDAVVKFLRANLNGEKKERISSQEVKETRKENPLPPSKSPIPPPIKLPKTNPPLEIGQVSPSEKKIAFLVEYEGEKVLIPEISTSTLDDLSQKIRERLKIKDNDAKIEILSEDFNEYVELDDFELLQKTKHRLRISPRKKEPEQGYYDSINEKSQEKSGMDIRSDIPSKEVKKGRKLAEGNFGIVYEGKWKDQSVAIKELKKMDEKFLEEVNLLR